MAIEIPEKPKWINLRDKLKCDDCKIRTCCHQKYYTNPSTLLDCSKKTGFLKIFECGISAIPIFFIFRIVFYAIAQQFFLALFLSLTILFVYDIIFLLIEKLLTHFFELLEKNRKRQFEKQIEVINGLESKKKEEEIQKKEKAKLRFQEVENAQKICDEFKNLKDTAPIETKFSKSYLELLHALQEICDDLVPEHFANPSMKNLFRVYLPELLEVCKDFSLQYKEKVLSPKETDLFKKLLKTTKDRLVKVKQDMWQQEITTLYVNMSALEEALSTNNENKEAKK